MSKIKILPEQVANQIAAGEVVERPASVVKELVENAVDAGARHLSVEVEGNGTRLIRVADDGEGMDQDDVLLCLERHATSKLSSGKQLSAITTLGFRGEAVPSIASVAVLSITSRPVSSPLGTRAEIRFGALAKVHEMGCGPGTIMEVRELFGNVPARRKFLKSTQTELAHIEEVVRNYALAGPGLGWRLVVNGREILSLPSGADSLEQRFRRLLGRRGPGPLVRVAADPHGIPGLTGYLLPPEEAGLSARLALFVNGRAVRDRLLHQAVMEGMRGFLMQGRRPAGALFVELSPEEVDVNVHPAKQEVRFRQPARIHHQVATAVARSLTLHQQEARRSFFALPARKTETAAGQPASSPLTACQVREPEAGFSGPAVPAPRSLALPPDAAAGDQQPLLPAGATGRDFAAGPVNAAKPQEEGEPRPAPSPPSLRLLGQVLHSYLLCESPAGLVVIDQHAAHERLLFEQLQQGFLHRNMIRQSLLFPRIVELQPEQWEVAARHRREIEQFGIELQEFGGTTMVIKALPALLAHLPPEEVLIDLLARYSAPEDEGKSGNRLHAILATMACKAAVKAGHSLTPAESASLLKQMLALDRFSHCPHGRPVMKSFSGDDLRKWFHRS